MVRLQLYSESTQETKGIWGSKTHSLHPPSCRVFFFFSFFFGYLHFLCDSYHCQKSCSGSSQRRHIPSLFFYRRFGFSSQILSHAFLPALISSILIPLLSSKVSPSCVTFLDPLPFYQMPLQKFLLCIHPSFNPSCSSPYSHHPFEYFPLCSCKFFPLLVLFLSSPLFFSRYYSGTALC